MTLLQKVFPWLKSKTQGTKCGSTKSNLPDPKESYKEVEKQIRDLLDYMKAG